MDGFHRAVQALERLNEPELLEAYRRFVARLEGLLTPEEMEIYTDYQQRISMGSSARPEEQAAADKVESDSEALSLYQHYLDLLDRRQTGAPAGPATSPGRNSSGRTR